MPSHAATHSVNPIATVSHGHGPAVNPLAATLRTQFNASPGGCDPCREAI